MVLACFYWVPFIVDVTRFERNTEATCSVIGFDVKQRDCTITRCFGTAPNQVCNSVATICSTCRYLMAMTSQEGLPVVAYSDYDGNFAGDNEARA